jgi:hypothetical protein
MMTMKIERLHEILDAYGASPAHWPEGERTEAVRLISESAEAHALYESAADLDLMLDTASPPPPPSRELIAKVLASAPASRAAGAGDRTRVTAFRRRSWRVMAVPLAAAAALAIWMATTRDSTVEAPIEIAAPATPDAEDSETRELASALSELVEYSSATDALLSPYGVDVYSVTPSFGCESSLLGCPTMQEQDPSESRQAPKSRRPIA